MEIFGKEVNLKDYNCSKNGVDYPQISVPMINLYVQITSSCNGACYFCNTRNSNKDFDIVKFSEIIDELKKKIYIGKVAISGGEPLLNLDKTIEVINTCGDLYVTLNTNAYNLYKLKELYSMVQEIHISKHHYNNKLNNEIMKLQTPSLLEIYDFGLADKVKINCVYQKGYMETVDDMIEMLEHLSWFGYKELRNISMLPLTPEAVDKYIDLTGLMDSAEDRFLNDGYLYDKKMCKCFELMYTAKNGRNIKSLIRQTYNDDYPCVKQLVFDGKNLYDGFRKNNIIY